MITVQQVLQRKAQQGCIHISPEATVFAALRLMADENVGALLVMENGVPVGMFSERDYARRIVLRGLSSANTPVRAVMSTDLLSVGPEESIVTCMALMTDNHIRHLPVLDHSKQIVGLISIGDVVSAIISHQQSTIEHLERYIYQ